MSRLNTCTEHQAPATGRCRVCHKPLCGRCTWAKGCCSERCARSQEKFSTARYGQVERPSPWPERIVALVKLLVFAAVVYGALRYFDVVPKIPQLPY